MSDVAAIRSELDGLETNVFANLYTLKEQATEVLLIFESLQRSVDAWNSLVKRPCSDVQSMRAELRDLEMGGLRLVASMTAIAAQQLSAALEIVRIRELTDSELQTHL